MTEEILKEYNSDKYDFLKTDKRLSNNITLLGLSGSYAYGTNIDGSDIDIRGIRMNTAEELLGITKDTETIVDNQTDTVIYSMKKAVELLMKGNPAMLEVIGVRDEDYLLLSDAGKELVDNRHLFFSKRLINTFGGYAKSQLNRLVNYSGRARLAVKENEMRSLEKAFMSLAKRYPHYVDGSGSVTLEDGELYISAMLQDIPLSELANIANEINSLDREYRKSVRNVKAANHGKLPKHQMHLIRLYCTGLQVLENEELNTYRSDEHELLMAIRRGEYLESDGLTPTKEFEKLLDDYEKRWEKAANSTKLPDEPDYDAINKLMIKINKELFVTH